MGSKYKQTLQRISRRKKSTRLKLSHAKKIEENVEGIEFVVPRNRNQAFVVRNFLSGSFSVNGDYPLLDKVQKKEIIKRTFHQSKRY